MSGGKGAFGTKIKIMIGAVMTAIVNATEIETPEQEKVLWENTAHPVSGNTGWTTFLDTGKRKLNEFALKLAWDVDEATHQALLDAFDGVDPVTMSVEDPDGEEVITFSAFISKIGRVTPQEEGWQCEVSIQPTGEPSFSGSGS